MTESKFIEKLNAWTVYYGWNDESLNDFANVHAESYKEYCIIWEAIEALKAEA